MVVILDVDLLPCLTSGPPLTNAVLRWNRRATIAVYQCPVGYVFDEGGTIRSVGCSNGQWQDLLPVCRGR